jgi:diguanylate cyclase (GGDEF)-like protein
MEQRKFAYLGRSLLIAAEVLAISLLDYSIARFSNVEVARYISLDVLYCLPIIQTARLTAIHTMRRYDTQTSTVVGTAVALIWSASELIITWPYFPIAAFVLNTFTRSVVFTVIGRVLVKLWRERKFAYLDVLTGLANRLELLERLEAEQSRSERSGRPYSLLLIDIDHFKMLNDDFGHHVGDEALKVMADILRGSSRKMDVPARLGGDEFVLLLPETDKSACDVLVKRLEASAQQAFAERSWPISLSIGRTTNIGKNQDADMVLRLADENMYQAKKLKQQMKQDDRNGLSRH